MATKLKETSEGGQRSIDTHGSHAPSLDQPEPESLRPLVLQALEDANEDRQQAVLLLAERVLSDAALLRAHLMKVVHTWADDQVGGVLTQRRARIIELADAPAAQRDRLQHAMRNEMTRLMDQLLYGGKRIGDATATEIRESAQKNATLSRTYSRQAKWQEAVAAAAEKNGTPDAPVRDTLSEKTLNELWEQANAD